MTQTRGQPQGQSADGETSMLLLDADTPRIDPRAFGLTKAAYSVRETLDLLSIGCSSLYAAVKRGEIKRVKFGKRTLFCAADIATFLMRL